MGKSLLLLLIVVTTIGCGKIAPEYQINPDFCAYQSNEKVAWPDQTTKLSEVYTCQTRANGVCAKFVSGPEFFYKCEHGIPKA